MSRITKTLLAVALAFSISPARAENANERLKEATEVVNELMGTQDQGIPSELLEKAECAIVIPGAKKGGFFVGAQYGRGFAICRTGSARGWGAPAAVRMEGGSFGLQIGAQEMDIFMLVMNKKGMEHLLESKFTLGGAASAAAGPVGRSSTAQTDAQMQAQILSWSRARGAFAGLTINGGTLRNDLDENEELYGKRITNKEVLTGAVKAPASASGLVAALNRFGGSDQQRTRTTK